MNYYYLEINTVEGIRTRFILARCEEHALGQTIDDGINADDIVSVRFAA